MDILHKESISLKSTGGKRECQLVTDSALQNIDKPPNSWQGLGNFVYLSDIEQQAQSDGNIQRHYDLDIITLPINGNLLYNDHQDHNNLYSANEAIIQRAGSQGIKLTESNPENYWSRYLEIRLLPERQGNPSEYKVLNLEPEQINRIYGSSDQSITSFKGKTLVDIARLSPKQYLSIDEGFIAYLYQGSALVNNRDIHEGTLIKDKQLKVEAIDESYLLIIRLTSDI